MTAAQSTFRDPKVLIPFLLITLIWSSTWIVIKDQLGTVPPTWSVTYRFIVAAAAMFAWAAASGTDLRIGRSGHAFAALFGIPQFCLNFNFVYAAEHHVTSGLVATVFALLMVPNSALAWLFLKQKASLSFIAGSAIACAGVALLFLQEMRSSPAAAGEVLLGVGLTVLGVLSASAANIMQASRRLAAWPLISLLAWGMVYGVIANAALAWVVAGPPAIESRPAYWLGLVYLGLFASALAFPFYFGVMRAVGPGKAAYSSVLVPILAMLLSTLFEGYRWSALAAAGAILALAGLVIALRSRARASGERATERSGG
ncbi:MAG TPA: DMT family transporter [Allosphingosinicella sp.]|nr:DMT family transporter [Allosphingosinicella sp.]